MHHPRARSLLLAPLAALALVASACSGSGTGGDEPAPADQTSAAAEEPQAIVSLAPTTTEMLYAVGATWVRPELVVEVEYAEWTTDGRLRHPTYAGRRIDVDAADVTATP